MTTMLWGFHAVSFGLFWIMVPPRRRWRDSICAAAAIALYAAAYGLCALAGVFAHLSAEKMAPAVIAAVTAGFLLFVLLTSRILCVDTRAHRLWLTVNLTSIFFGAELFLAGVQLFVFRQPLTGDSPMRCLSQMLSPILQLSASVISASFWNSMEKRLRRRIILLAVALPVSQCACMLGIAIWNHDVVARQMLQYCALLTLMSLAADFILYRMITQAIQVRKDQLRLERLKEKQETQYQYYRLMQLRAEEQARFRHDFQNQLQVLYTLLCHNNRDKSELLLREMNKRLDADAVVSYEALPVVNAIVNLWESKARSQAIAFQAEIQTLDWKIEELEQYTLFDKLLGGVLATCETDADSPQIQLYAWKENRSCRIALRWTRQETLALEPVLLEARGRREQDPRRMLRNILQAHQGSYTERWDGALYCVTLELQDHND